MCANAIEIPAYINLKANVIEAHDAQWDSLRKKVARTLSGDTADINILHIGDSHIQAEFVTNHLRKLLQQRYGNSGRGLMSPLRLAGTNQPTDYAITAPAGSKFTQTRLLKYPWPTPPGFTGIAARNDSAELSVTVRPLLPEHAMTQIQLITDRGVSTYHFQQPVDSADCTLHSGETLYGVIAGNSRPGVLYSAIGNNGACFTDYMLIKGFANATRIFGPDLIILSMGTNEGFSSMTDEQIHTSVLDMVKTLRNANPQAAMLILTPMECQKNRNHGHKPLSPYFDVNKRVSQARDIIAATARELNVPVWDFYEVAGGDGASDLWLADKLMNPNDHIHLLKPGYELMGELLYKALVPSLENL